MGLRQWFRRYSLEEQTRRVEEATGQIKETRERIARTADRLEQLVAERASSKGFSTVNQARIDELAPRLYEAYRAATGGVSLVSGAPLPEWDALGDDIQGAWIAVATEAVDRLPDDDAP